MTIRLTREEAQQVLDALDYEAAAGNDDGVWKDIRDVLRARIAQPEPDYRDVVIKGDLWRIEFLPDHAASVVLVRANYEAQPEEIKWDASAPLVMTPHPAFAKPQRNWQGLTDEEIGTVIADCNITLVNYCSEDKQTEFARAIEAKLKEKNT